MSSTCNYPTKTALALALLCAYGGLLFVGAIYHEIWRDEMRALTIATTSGELSEIAARLRNEGHPLLWYAILKFAYLIVHDSIVLKVCALLTAAAAAVVFVFRAPFPFYIRAMWLFGLFPLYEYSVMSRNYGIGMLFIFLAAASYKERFLSPWKIAVALSLAALTSAYGIIHALAMAAALLVEPIIIRSRRSKETAARVGAAALPVLLTAGISLWMIFPDRSTTVTELHSLGSSEIIFALLGGLLRHGATFHNGLVSPFPFIVPLVLASVYFLIMRSPCAVVYLCAVVVGMETFSELVYSGAALRHQGFLLLGIFVAVWLSRAGGHNLDSTPETGGWSSSASLLDLGLAILLALQIFVGVKAYSRDIVEPRSSSESFAHFVRTNGLESAIIAAEPDVVLESLPYYLNNPIYLVRERRFGSVVSFTTESEPELSLTQLLIELESLGEKQDRPLILLLPPDLSEDSRLDVGYDRTLSIDRRGAEHLSSAAEKLACFTRAITDENYCVWKLKEKEKN